MLISSHKRNVTHVKKFHERASKEFGNNEQREMNVDAGLSDNDDLSVPESASSTDLETSHSPEKSPVKPCDIPRSPTPALSRPKRTRRKPEKFKDFVT